MSEKSSKSIPTYERTGLQVLAYKKVQQWVNEVLRHSRINTSQWIILGQLYEHKGKGLRSTDLAKALQVEIPLITTLTQSLANKQLIQRTTHSEDKRVRLLELTPKGDAFVKDVESQLEQHLASLNDDIDEGEMRAYFSVLQKLAHR